jgi:hypothetical protein
MNTRDQNTDYTIEGALIGGARSNIRIFSSLVKWTVLTALGLFVVLIILGIGGYSLPFWPSAKEVTQEKPYADFVGREYQVTGNVSALAWNDFPDKKKILSVSLTPPDAQNRFVSYSIPLKAGQRVRILSAWRHFALVEFTYSYVVSVPGVDLPEGVPVKLSVDSDGVPNPLFYEAVGLPIRAKAQH